MLAVMKNFDLFVNLIRKGNGLIKGTVVTDTLGVKYLSEFKDLIASGQLKVETNLSSRNLEESYRNCDVYVHPSRFEGFGLPLPEAVSFGKPVVFLSGSAPDELIPDAVGIRMDLRANLDDWIDGIKSMAGCAESTDFQKKCANALDKIGGWSLSANKHKTVYKNLLK